MACDLCTQLLSEGMDLCVRARKIDATERTRIEIEMSSDGEAWAASDAFQRHVTRNNIRRPHQPLESRSGTVAAWVLDQYERDLADWENRSRRHLTMGCRAAGADVVEVE